MLAGPKTPGASALFSLSFLRNGTPSPVSCPLHTSPASLPSSGLQRLPSFDIATWLCSKCLKPAVFRPNLSCLTSSGTGSQMLKLSFWASLEPSPPSVPPLSASHLVSRDLQLDPSARRHPGKGHQHLSLDVALMSSLLPPTPCPCPIHPLSLGGFPKSQP